MASYVEEVSNLEIGEQIGSGGQAVVHRVLSPQWPNTLFKNYRGASPIAETIDALAQWRDQLNDLDLEVLDTSTSWPQARVVDRGETVGVLIPEAPSKFMIDVRGSARLNELSYLAFGDRSRKLGLSTPEPYLRASIVSHLVSVMELFERHNIVHGDISFKNLLWSTKPSPGCYLLDCDGVRMGDLPPALPHVTTQHWTDPRLQNGEIRHPDLESDRLALALVFYRSYFQARGDFTGGKISLGIPDSPAIDDSVSDLLSRALIDSAPRPAAAEWRVIENLIAAKAADRPSEAASSSAPPISRDHPAAEKLPEKPPPVFSTTVGLIPDTPQVAATSALPTTTPSVSVGAQSSSPTVAAVSPVVRTPAFTAGWIATLLLLLVISAAAGFTAVRMFVL